MSEHRTGHWFALAPRGFLVLPDPDLPPLGQHPMDSWHAMQDIWVGRYLIADDFHLHVTADVGVIRWLAQHYRHRILVWNKGEWVSVEEMETVEWLDAVGSLSEMYALGNIGAERWEEA